MKRFEIMLVLVAVLLVGLVVVVGCSKKSEPAATKTAGGEQILQKTCPIMVNNPINKKLFTEYKGKKVYFCCPGCKPKFEADPAKYIASLPQFKK